MAMEATVATYGRPTHVVYQGHPDDCLVCSVLMCLFCNPVCGILAVICSCMARSAFSKGDISTGVGRAKVASAFNIIGTLITIIPLIAVGIYFVYVSNTGKKLNT